MRRSEFNRELDETLFTDCEVVLATSQQSTSLKPFSREALERAIWFNTWLLAAISGIISGLALFSLTHLSLLLTGARAGRYLNLSLIHI